MDAGFDSVSEEALKPLSDYLEFCLLQVRRLTRLEAPSGGRSRPLNPLSPSLAAGAPTRGDGCPRPLNRP